jgi:Trp operon repressor
MMVDKKDARMVLMMVLTMDEKKAVTMVVIPSD